MAGRKKKAIWLVMLAFSILVIALFAYNQVDNTITVEDILYIQKILVEANVKPISARPSYEEEIGFIIGVQKAVLDMAVKSECLPKGASREPKDLYSARCGESYDRSRVIEKTLRNAGFQTRHFMVFSTRHTGSKIRSLLSPRALSHSATEVSTKKGWLVLDPDEPWLSLDDKGEPISIVEMESDVSAKLILWNSAYSADMNPLYKEPFVFLYGLYSRHGQFYPPHNFIPDINWREFICNLTPNS